MKYLLVILLLLYSHNALSCSCWLKYHDETQNEIVEEFLGVVVGGDAIVPGSKAEQLAWKNLGRVVTKLRVVDTLNSKLTENQIVEIHQPYNSCVRFFIPLVEYRINAESTNSQIDSNSCKISLENTEALDSATDHQLQSVLQELKK